MTAFQHQSTRLLHDGEQRETYHGCINPPVYHGSVYGFRTYADFLAASDNAQMEPWYGRFFNPTVNVLEQKIAMLENAPTAIAFSSGMGAITAALLTLLKKGDHLLVVDSVFGPVRQFCKSVLAPMGIETEYFGSHDCHALGPRIRPATKAIYVESPGSLTFDIQDLQAVAATARSKGVLTIADNTCATPVFQRPIDWGIDIVVHSGTKYLSGHSDLTFGAIACSEQIFARIKPVAILMGANLAPDDAYLALRGLRTLTLRMATHHESGLKIARWLAVRPEVRQVLHPGLETSAYHALALRQQSGFSGTFAVRLQPTSKSACHAFVDALEIFTIGTSWGGFESLVMPLEYVHREDHDLRQLRDLDDSMFRLSIGLEEVDDLVRDLSAGLVAWREANSK